MENTSLSGGKDNMLELLLFQLLRGDGLLLSPAWWERLLRVSVERIVSDEEDQQQPGNHQQDFRSRIKPLRLGNTLEQGSLVSIKKKKKPQCTTLNKI